jgi:hypothetical protein
MAHAGKMNAKYYSKQKLEILYGQWKILND